MDKVLILYFAEIFRRVRLSKIYLQQDANNNQQMRTQQTRYQ